MSSIDQKTAILLNQPEFTALINALKIVHTKSATLVDRMILWTKIPIGQNIPNEDISRIQHWIKPSSPDDHSYKVARALLWYIMNKYLKLPEFQRIDLDSVLE